MRVTPGHVEGLALFQRKFHGISLRILHNHIALSIQGIIYLRGIKDGVEMSLGHKVFISDDSRVEDRGSKCQIPGPLRTSQFMKLIDQGIAAF